MKKTIFAILLWLVTFHNSFSQNYEIEYNHIVTFDAIGTEMVYKLVLHNQESIYYQLKHEIIQKNSDEVIPSNDDVIFFVAKDYANKKMLYNQPIISKIVFIEDELPMQTWKLINETKKINSFICKKATTTFRGRKYTAWYTEEFPIIGGPWKFDGLPGLILEAYSDDGVLKIEAVKIEKKPQESLYKFEYDEADLISWEDYCKNYREVIERIKKNMQAESEPDVEMNITIREVEDIGL